MKNVKPRSERAIITRVSCDVGDELAKLAARNERSLAGEVRLAIRNHIETAPRQRTAPRVTA